MKSRPFIALFALLVPSQIMAQDAPTPTPAEQPPATVLPEAEKHVREGLQLLASLYEVLEGINDPNSAEAAVAKLIGIQKQLIQWGQKFSTLTPLTKEEQSRYENAYLPLIREINEHIRGQAQRLHSAQYYNSKNLPLVLIDIVNQVK